MNIVKFSFCSLQTCGGCWAFAAIQQVEFVLYKHYGFTQFATQPVLDCDKAVPNVGCSGGWPANALSKKINFRI